MTAITMEAMDVARDLPLSVSPATRGRCQRGLEHDRAPGMPLLGFVTAMTLSAGLWGLIGLVAWSIIS